MIDAHLKRLLLAAEGYQDLGLMEEAWEELNAVPPQDQSLPEVIQLRVQLLMKQDRWEEGLTNSQELMRLAPQASAGYIHSAYCLHELGRTDEALEVLMDGPPSLHKEPTYYYNLGCYQAQLGDLANAKLLVRQSIEMDQRLEAVAKKDTDLQAIWADL